jgi:prepilin signal peptidase PulO-like enzyme (type II secretory pathway)
MLRRRGLSKTIEFFFAALRHHWTWKLLVAMWIAGGLFISISWVVGGNPWYGLFSALVGLAVGGGTIWSIRIVASWAMDMEAMGFGDVTLMAMVGAVIGWQGAVLGFFLSPFAAIVIVLVQYVVTRNRHVPFGPYLCAGTLLVMVFWDAMYNQWLACNLLMLWPMLRWLALTCLGLMGVMLFVSRLIKTYFGGVGQQ